MYDISISFNPFSFRILFILIAIFLLLLFFNNKNRKHKRNIKSAESILKKLDSFQHPGAKINYLRKIDPFVFEELILSAFKKKGMKIKRNKRYTGDGGVDGTMWDSDKRKHLIQAKRYTSYVNRTHILEFQTLVQKNKCHSGLFIHTGKTGKQTYDFFKNGSISIISGDDLIQLISNSK